MFIRKIRPSPCIAPLRWLFWSGELILKVFLPPSDRCEDVTEENAKEGRKELPDGNNNGDPRQDELDELVRLIQIVLAGDIVFHPIIVVDVLATGQVQDGHERDFGAMGRNGPNGEDLGKTNIENQVLLIVGHTVDLCADARRHDLVPAVDSLNQVARMR